MKYFLAIALVLAGVSFPLALGAQSVRLVSGSSAPTALSAPGSFHDGNLGFDRRFNGGGLRSVAVPPFFGYPPNYPFTYFFPGLWAPLDYEYEQAWQIAHGDVAGEVAAQQKDYLSSQVQQLTNEVRSLQQQQGSRQYMQAPSAAPGATYPQQPPAQKQFGAEEEFPITVFIYRDGRSLEVRDYAVFGETLWVFHGNRAQKIPLADFNIAASRQVNEEHGVEFPLSDRH